MDKYSTALDRARAVISEMALREGVPEESIRDEMLAAIGLSADSASPTARFIRAGLSASGDISPEAFIALIAVYFF